MSIRRVRLLYSLLDRFSQRSVMPRFHAALEREAGSRESLEAHAANRLRALLDHARREVPFYRDRLGPIASNAGALASDAFATIPALEKKDLAEASDRLLAAGRRDTGDGVTVVTSGGTTGPPTRVVLDQDTVDAHTAATLRSYAWWGADPTGSHVMLWGPPLGENTYLSLAGRIRGLVLGRRLLSTWDLDAVRARELWQQVRRIRLDHLLGYSSALVRVAEAQQNAEVAQVRSAVIAAAEPIFDFQRPAIAAAFGAPVRERYGCNEFSLIAQECAQGRLHVAIDRVRLDLVGPDGREVPRGDVGRMLVTDLDNYHMPLIRYRIGDLAQWGPDCTCGLPFPVLARVHGRERDRIEAADGRPLTPHDFAGALDGSRATGMEIAVDSRRRVREIRVVGRDLRRELLQDCWSELAGDPVEVVEVREVKRSGSGKILPVVEFGS